MANSFTRLAGHCLNTAESTLIQGNVNDNRLDLDTYRNLFSEGSVYSLSTCLSDAPVSIQFNDGTLFVEIKNSVKQIPIEFFGFGNHDQLLSLLIPTNSYRTFLERSLQSRHRGHNV
ncbi:unnamed protein product [Brassica oleracea var. botrytis]